MKLSDCFSFTPITTSVKAVYDPLKINQSIGILKWKTSSIIEGKINIEN